MAIPEDNPFEPPTLAVEPRAAAEVVAEPEPVLPTPGEVITSLNTGVTYTIGKIVGEGVFGIVHACIDDWNNALAAKVLKPTKPADEMQAAALEELTKLVVLRHPQITYCFDAFVYRGVHYIITERCLYSLAELLKTDWFTGPLWTMAVARSLLQAVQFLHFSGYAHQDIHAANMFALFAPNELNPDQSDSIQFRLGDLGVAKLKTDIRPENTRAQWMLPPEVLNPAEFGTPDHRVDIYHAGLLLLQLEYSTELRFSREEILEGRPREMALALRSPFNFALEKALRRHVAKRTESARELWRDLNSRAEVQAGAGADQAGGIPDAGENAAPEAPAVAEAARAPEADRNES